MSTYRRISLIMLLCLCVLPAFAAEPRALTLAEAVALALQHNPALRDAQGKTETAQAQIEQARAGSHTQVKLSSQFSAVSKVPEFTINPNQPPVKLGGSSSLLTDLGAQQVIYSGGRLEALVRQATDAAKAVEATNTRTRQVVAFNAERAFLVLLTAQRAREVAQQALTTAQEHLKVAQARLDARAAPRFDVLRAEVDVSTAQGDATRADADIEVAQATLQQALGVEDQTFTAVAPDLKTDTPVPVEADLLAQAQASRPELRALDWQRQAAEAAISAAKGERKPTISLLADYQNAIPETVTQIDRFSFGVGASLPIFDGGLAKAKERAAAGQRTQVLAAVDALRASIATDVKQARARVISAAAQIDTATKGVALADEALRIANVRYEAGVATPTEVSDAQTALTRARQALTAALDAWGTANAELRLAIGTEPVQ